MDIITCILYQFSTRRTGGVSVIALQVVRQCAVSVSYKVNVGLFAAHSAGDGASFG